MTQVFSYEICEILNFLQNTSGRLLLIVILKHESEFLAIENTLPIDGISGQNHPRKQDFLRFLKDRYIQM